MGMWKRRTDELHLNLRCCRGMIAEDAATCFHQACKVHPFSTFIASPNTIVHTTAARTEGSSPKAIQRHRIHLAN